MLAEQSLRSTHSCRAEIDAQWACTTMDRPFRVLHAQRFTTALIDSIHDPGLRAVPLTGSGGGRSGCNADDSGLRRPADSE